ncbi:MAG: omega-6 fatty acid desaturase (delta-12 desaturase) [Desulforhopalus sp.]|jgi:omega-6 fatty acid desaturase (delta-12 desaturase)
MAIYESGGVNKSEEEIKPRQIWPEWHQALKGFSHPSKTKVTWQLTNTLVPYFFLWYLMVRSIQLGYSYIWTLTLAVPAAAFLVRVFILFHDCVHGSFLKSKNGNIFFRLPSWRTCIHFV